MSIFEQVWRWFTDPENWSGADGIPNRLWEHVEISAASVAIAVLLALPIGLLIGHTRRGEFVAVTVSNLGRAIPSFALIALMFPLFLRCCGAAGFGTLPTIVAMVLLAIPPILTNTYVGVQAVDADTVEAARGMGMSGRQVLQRLEMPLAVPLILAGVRTAAVQVVATATLSALFAGGGLGRLIVDGFARQRYDMMVGGAILVALLAIAVELALSVAERMLTPTQVSVPAEAGRWREVRQIDSV
jgi:osmoprotectant transport system permease protein